MLVRFLVLCGLSLIQASSPEGVEWLEQNGQKEGVVVTESGLQYRVIKSGPPGSEVPKANSPCQCNYRGTLIDGTEFDSSRGSPVTFAPNQVIKGWTEAMQLMQEGDHWELTIPSELAYGNSGSGKIPGGAVLIFELEILKVNEPSPYIYFGIDFAAPTTMLMFAAVSYVIFQQFAPDTGPAAGKPKLKLADAKDPKNPIVFLEMSIGDKPAGRIEMELFAKICPKTAENFRCLCTGEKKSATGGALHFKGSNFHRIIPGFMCQGGDFTRGNGTGGESIYGAKFEDEFDNGVIGHSEPFLLSMANAGPGTNGSQFFLTTGQTPHLDGKHVVFGRVISGKEVVEKMEAVGSSSGAPKEMVKIADCGQSKSKAT